MAGTCSSALSYALERLGTPMKQGQLANLSLLTTCFMSNQIFRVGGGLWFLFDSYALLYQKLLLVITHQRHFVFVWNWLAFIIGLITRLSCLPIGEPGNVATTESAKPKITGEVCQTLISFVKAGSGNDTK